MSQFKGALIGLLLFVVFFLPFSLFMVIQAINTNAYLKVTTEMQQIVTAEGGVTSKVLDISNNLKKNGYEVTFYDSKGKAITGKQPVGTTIQVNYKYTFNNVKGQQTLETSNYVLVHRR